MVRLIPILCLGATVLVGQAQGSPSFPIQYSASERYLLDQNRAPFPIKGRAAWFITSLSASDYQTFIDDTTTRGYNSIEFHVVNHDPRGNHPPLNGNGDLPFLNRLDGAVWSGSLSYGDITTEAPDFTTPNEAYWSFVDDLLTYCEQKGLLVLFFPAYVGFEGGNQGWMQELVANGSARMQSYGAWIATRYQNRTNLVWMMGGDLGKFNAAQTNVEAALFTGLKSVAGLQSIYFSAEWNSGMTATDQAAFGAAMTLNGSYSFEGDISTVSRSAYAHVPPQPAFLLESPFDQEGLDGNGVNPNATQPVRRFQWWAWLSSIGGYIAGNGYVWPFRSPAWQQHLDSQGSQDIARLNGFVDSIKWYKLVPAGLNTMRTLITAGGSSVSATDYVAAAASLDGTLLVAYIPPAHTGSITVDMGALSGVSGARWFDPTSGLYTEIESGLPNTDMHMFTPPGNNSVGDADWVLVIDRVKPSDTVSPTVTVNAPTGGTVSGSVSVIAAASDDIGVIGVRFQVDGVDLGAETQLSPYGVTWNTREMSNGTHVVRAIARDLADNTASSSVTVTVNNNMVSANVMAYGFIEGAGTSVADSSGYGNTGVINGAAWTSLGKFGNALSFNGTNGNWVTANDADSLDPHRGVTLEAWVYPTALPGNWTTIVLKETPPSALCYMMQGDPSNHPSAFVTTDHAGLQGVIGPDAVLLNTWTHLSATYDGTALRLYVNGTVVATHFVVGSVLGSSGPLRLGGNSIWGEYFVGTIDETRVYNRALNQAEIQTDMNTPITLPTPSPTPNTVSISGLISYCTNPSHGPVPNVTLNLTGGTTGSTISNASGNYQFSSVPTGGAYTITPSKAPLTPGSTGSKINTIDMVAVQRHFLQIMLLSGCPLTAADANGDHAVNTIDVIAIQGFFLARPTGLGNVGKYQFVPVNRSYSGIATDQNSQNYDTLIFGDVATPYVH